MNLHQSLTCIVLAATLCACSAVYHPSPFGESPAKINAEDWEGTWAGEEMVFTIEARDVERGQLMATFFTEDDPGPYAVHLLETGGWLVASIREWQPSEDSQTPPPDLDRNKTHYNFFRVKVEGDEMLIWQPDEKKFQRLVESGLLPGEASQEEHGHTWLGELSTEHYVLITSGEQGVLMEWDDPGVFRRVID